MVASIPIFQARDGHSESFYAPTFRVEVGPEEGSLKPLFDVWKVTFKDAVNQIDSFDLTLNNWNWNPTETRYSEHLPGDGEDPRRSPLSVLPGAWARLWMGYQGPTGLYPMLTGRVTSVTPTFGDSGVTLTVRALSTLEALREKPKEFKWTPQPGKSVIKDLEIADAIARKYNLTLVPPRGLQEAGERSITQANETDIAFLIKRAKARGYVVCFREGLPGGGARHEGAGNPDLQKFLYFGPSYLLQEAELVQMGDRSGRFELAWGKSLIEFRPTFNLSTNMWRKVTLSFWNRQNRNKSPKAYTLDDLWRDEKGLNHDLEPLIPMEALGEHEVTNVPVTDEAEAQELARNSLRENFLQMVTADGSTVGLPELRSCSRIRVSGTGVLSGSYFVTSTTHSIDDSGYRTQFSARREQLEGAGQ